MNQMATIMQPMSLLAFLAHVGVPKHLQPRARLRLIDAEFSDTVAPADAGLAQTIIQDMVQAEEKVELQAAQALGIRRTAATTTPICPRCGGSMRGPILSAGNIPVFHCEADRVTKPVEE
jgi:hypothetical protein